MAINSVNSSGMRRQPRQARSLERVSQILDVAERLFITDGYNATTTNAIANGAKVSIGSLYQFFPDKGAIVGALAMRYTEQLHHRFLELDATEMVNLNLSAYVDRIVDTTAQFFTDYPGYHSIFMQVQGTISELEEIENAADARLIAALAISLSRYNPGLAAIDYEAISFTLVKAIGTLLWLSLSQDRVLGERLVIETKRLMLSYLQGYFGST